MRTHKISMANDEDEDLRQSDLDSADSGPKFLMPPTEFLGTMPSEADSFAGYLAPYAFLVLLAFGQVIFSDEAEDAHVETLVSSTKKQYEKPEPKRRGKVSASILERMKMFE